MPTIKDVAQKAGVTVTTVSRVLNNRGYISEATRQKVYQAMEELHYQPNEIARSLHRRKSNIIGVIIPTVAHPFFGELTNFIEFYAYQQGYKIMVCNSHLNRDKEKEYIDMLKRNQVDGIIMGSHTLDVEEYHNLRYPIVTFDRKIGDFPYIASNNYQGGTLATNLLISKGCKKIAHICGNLTLDLLANQRSEAFQEITNQHGIESVTVQTNMDVFDDDQYESILNQLFSEHGDIDGVFATSDIIAAYALKVCRLFKKEVPHDIKIVGYDDVKLASIFVPQLTTIRQPLEDMAALAVEVIVKQINGENTSLENVFPVKLMERQTT
ncbi:LacI family DNA-binding transcriptional regulator [Effusibacillus consociatus]|uniref:LacI family DNA-binding transcriptional regulator n=1 Tax=Effusibacillus consociatus TaxID=1117041 RepID=A0ABV9Q7B0_9BACL